MAVSQSQAVSLWSATVELPSQPVLDSDVTADVCVVGAGIAGLTTAYLLGREGKRVVVIDDGPIASGQTCMTTAHLASEIDDRLVEIERIHGAEGARLAAESHAAAIDRIEAISRDEGIDCDFERVAGYLFTPPGQSAEILDQEYEAAIRTGVLEVERLPKAPLTDFDTGPCLRFLRQGQFHPLKYLARLPEAIRRDGGQVFTGAHAVKIEGGRRAQVETAAGPVVTADAVVVATNTPINDRFSIHTKQAPYLTYVVGLRVPAGSVAPALYWDTADPYHYVRLQRESRDGKGHDVLIVGGEDHKTGHYDDGEERFARLETWARERFPFVEGAEYHWSGQVMEPVDGVAFIGRNPLDAENVYIATGDSGQGITHGTIAGILLTDLILGRENPWSTLYDPSRKSLRALGDFAVENLNVAVQYTSWLSPGAVGSADDVPIGQGAVLRRGLSKVAVYRDEQGVLHSCSAVCPHLGCIVAWNSAAESWDCPCHGSRFDPLGAVINGPANSDLGRAE